MSALCAALLPALLLAPASAPERTDEGARRVESAGATELIYDDDEEVDGELLEAFGENLYQRRPDRRGSLITIRPTFVPELTELSWDI